MSDIFISYASKDREHAKALAGALESNGWSVWWDREIPFGKSFDEVIEENLAVARCVIVIWSNNSISSEWVKNEAREARVRHLLIPVLVDDVKLPLEFRDVQTANLIGWYPGNSFVEFEKLVRQLRKLLNKSSPSPSSAVDVPATNPPTLQVSTSATKQTSTGSTHISIKQIAAGGAILLAIIGSSLFAWLTPPKQDYPHASNSIPNPPPAVPPSINPSPVEVPDLRGKTVDEAQTQLSQAGLVLGSKKSIKSRDVQPGTIVSQSPESGEHVQKGQIVTLTISIKPNTEVPAVTGMPTESAKSILLSSGFTIEMAQEHTASTKPGIVLKQEPAASAVATEGSAVRITVSAPIIISAIKVPNLEGSPLLQATSTLRNAKLTVGSVTIKGYGPVAEKTVDSQDPPAGSKVRLGQRINIVLVEPGIAIRNVVGLELTAAKSALSSQGIELAPVRRQSSETALQGRVIRQEPAAGTWVAPVGAKVALTVSVPPQIGLSPDATAVKAPRLIKMSPRDAGVVAQRLGLTIGREVVRLAPTKEPIVIDQNPQPDSVIRPGQHIDLLVGAPRISIINVAGRDLNEAKHILERQGIVVTNIRYLDAPSTTNYIVIEQIPAAGTWIDLSRNHATLTVRHR